MARNKRASHEDTADGLVNDSDERFDAPAVFEREHLGKRRRGPNGIVWLAVVVLVVATLGVGGRVFEYMNPVVPPTTPPAIAWIDAGAQPTTQASTDGRPASQMGPCFASDLRDTATQRWVDVDSWPTSVIILRNMDPAYPCYVLGYAPGLTMYYENGEGYPADGYATYSTMVLGPGERMAVRLRFEDICRTFAQSTVKAYLSAVSNGSGVVDIPRPPGYESRCGSYPPGQPGKVYVGPYEKWPGQTAADLPNVRVSVAALQPGLAPGDRVSYVVEMTNISGRRISLEQCPTYRQYLLGMAVHDPPVYRLNCEAIGPWLEPNQTWRMNMVFPLPPETASGKATLVWEATSVIAGQMRFPVTVYTP